MSMCPQHEGNHLGKYQMMGWICFVIWIKEWWNFHGPIITCDGYSHQLQDFLKIYSFFNSSILCISVSKLRAEIHNIQIGLWYIEQSSLLDDIYKHWGFLFPYPVEPFCPPFTRQAPRVTADLNWRPAVCSRLTPSFSSSSCSPDINSPQIYLTCFSRGIIWTERRLKFV